MPTTKRLYIIGDKVRDSQSKDEGIVSRINPEEGIKVRGKEGSVVWHRNPDKTLEVLEKPKIGDQVCIIDVESSYCGEIGVYRGECSHRYGDVYLSKRGYTVEVMRMEPSPLRWTKD